MGVPVRPNTKAFRTAPFLNDGGRFHTFHFPAEVVTTKKPVSLAGAGLFLLPGWIHSPTAGPARFGSRRRPRPVLTARDAVILEGLCLCKKVARRVEGVDAVTDRKGKL
jgi:hypothetical protein